MRTVHEVSKITGVSARTLRYYDAIGLLKPAEYTEAGYRLYDDTALVRLQNILLFRELQFPLKEIRAILDRPGFDPEEALRRQIELLELQYRRLGGLISFAREIQEKGVTELTKMNFQVFDQSELEAYKKEAKERWGETSAYQEYERRQEERREQKGQREQRKQSEQENRADAGASVRQFMGLFAELGKLRGMEPSAEVVQEKIHAVQSFITENYYTCTDEILQSLGEMYVADERFKKNIDGAGGEGTAEFVREAISVYVAGK